MAYPNLNVKEWDNFLRVLCLPKEDTPKLTKFLCGLKAFRDYLEVNYGPKTVKDTDLKVTSSSSNADLLESFKAMYLFSNVFWSGNPNEPKLYRWDAMKPTTKVGSTLDWQHWEHPSWSAWSYEPASGDLITLRKAWSNYRNDLVDVLITTAAHPRVIWHSKTVPCFQDAADYCDGLLDDIKRANKPTRLDPIANRIDQVSWLLKQLVKSANRYSNEHEVLIYTPKPIKVTVAGVYP